MSRDAMGVKVNYMENVLSRLSSTLCIPSIPRYALDALGPNKVPDNLDKEIFPVIYLASHCVPI